MIAEAITATDDWLKTPFTTALNPVQVALLVGVIMAAIILWSRILAHLID
jgi:hypothetical protein